MISSLTSKFRYFDRRALFVSAHKAAVYHWFNGRITNSYLFDINDEGREHFERYLRQTPKSPIYIMVDVFEEEYRRETIPHVFGPDKQALLSRKQDRLFRDTPYTYTRAQGREEEGRRDDRILLTAITNADLVTPWVDAMDRNEVPVAGIYSLPLLVGSLIAPRKKEWKHVLVLSLQSISGLRQTFVQNGELRISRLVQMPRYGTTPYAPYIMEEVEKIQRYLNSLRLVPADEPVDICFLMTGELKDEIEQHYTDSEYIRYHSLDINEVAAEVGVESGVTTPFSDRLFVSYLLKKAPQNHYASKSQRRYYSMRRMRYAMLASSVLLMLAGVLWSGYNLFTGLSYKQQSISADLRREFYSTRYNMARERLPDTPVEPAELQLAVDLSDKLREYRTSPLETVQVISKGLNRYPRIQLKNVSWVASIDPNIELGKKSKEAPGKNKKSRQSKIGYSEVSYTDTGYLFYQVAQVDGYLDPFDGNFRQAIAAINEYAEFLRKQKSVHDVSIISLPLDVSSSTSLQGNTSTQASEANFSLRLVIGVGNEA